MPLQQIIDFCERKQKNSCKILINEIDRLKNLDQVKS